MPKNINLYAGPGQITLYDATNGYAFLGWADIEVQEKALTHENIQGDLIRYDRIFKLKAELPITDTPTLDDLEDRDGIDQNIYIAGFESMFTVSGARIVYEIERNWSGSKIHSVLIKAQWKDPDDHQLAVNLLTLNSDIEIKFENFTSGVADGWNVANEDVAAEDTTSFRTGSAQSIVYIGAPTGQAFYSDYITCPFSEALKVTASIYLRKDSGTADVQIGFGVKYSDDTTETFRTTYDNAALSGTGSRLSHTEVIVPSKNIKQILFSVYVENSGSIVIELDDAQIEFGNLSDFRED